MAIRVTVPGTDSGFSEAFRSGYRLMTVSGNGTVVRGKYPVQPSSMSRPGNLGTAYTGAWTGNVATPNDNHRPIPFKLLSVFSLIYRPGMNAALITR